AMSVREADGRGRDRDGGGAGVHRWADRRLPRARRRGRPVAVQVLYRSEDPGRGRDVRRERRAVRRRRVRRWVIQLRSGGIADRPRLLAALAPLTPTAKRLSPLSPRSVGR